MAHTQILGNRSHDPPVQYTLWGSWTLATPWRSMNERSVWYMMKLRRIFFCPWRQFGLQFPVEWIFCHISPGYWYLIVVINNWWLINFSAWLHQILRKWEMRRRFPGVWDMQSFTARIWLVMCETTEVNIADNLWVQIWDVYVTCCVPHTCWF